MRRSLDATIARAALGAVLLVLAGQARAMPPPIATFKAKSSEVHLAFMCGPPRTMFLAVSGLDKGWGREHAPEISIGSRHHFRLRIVADGDQALLSDLPAPRKGVSRRLISAAKSGRPIELVGLASKELPLGLRAFRLDQARVAIEIVEKTCGLAPAP